ncbi:MBL fold metallo-hydrolase [Gammaproteobacteria bacterium]|nr:MBL fold metallo-hydrolase [Gammaproteobacteria bacterium]MDC1147497.1 MBL fold metallo-hydrolase [Gammaproteobacteria bacterium]
MKNKFLLLMLMAPSLYGATKLIVLGSGTPNPDPNRAGSAYAVVVNETPYLIDFGPGVIRRAASLSPSWGGKIEAMTVKNFEHAFLTHIHSDHSAGLADLLLTPWIMGRDKKLNLYGPKGLEQMASSTLEAFEDDINYRIYGTQPSNKIGYKFNFYLLTEGLIYEDENVSVEAFTVPHGSFDDAYGFRFTTEDKVIVFSGDTGPSKTLEKFAAGADILVHEVYSNAGFLKKTKDWQVYHQGHHTSTFEVGEIASRAKPKLLLLSHILFWGSTTDEILKETQSTYKGEIKIAEDLMIIK